MSNRVGTMPYFLKRIEEVLRNDEIFMRLLAYPAEEISGVHPLDESLPNIIPDFKNAPQEEIEKYWDIVEERLRKGLKRTDIENDSIVVVYMYEGRKFRKFLNSEQSNQEVRFSIIAHESFESDYRFSLIADRISYLLANERHIAGVGKMRFISSKGYEAPLGYRRIEETYEFTTNTKRLWKK